MALDDNYLQTLKDRKKESHVYTAFQLAGLEIADVLEDRAHKALYIKLAKEYNPQALRELAASIAEKKDVKHKGAYFMAVFMKDKAKFKSRNGRTNLSKRQPSRRKSPAGKNKKV